MRRSSTSATKAASSGRRSSSADESAKRIALYCQSGWGYIDRLVAGVFRYFLDHNDEDFRLRDFRFWHADIKPPLGSPTWEGWKPHGIICCIDSRPGVAEWLKKTGVPVVNTSADCPHEVIPAVHGMGSGQLAAEYFTSLGFKHFAYIGHKWTLGSQRRRDAYAADLAARGHKLLLYDLKLKTEPFGAVESLEKEAAAEGGLIKFFQSAPKPLAVFALNDEFARVVCLVCRRLKLSIPDEVAILGVDDTSSARLNVPPLSTIRPPGERVGYEAMKLLHALIRGKASPPRAIEIPTTEIIIRDSTKSRANKDATVRKALRLIEAEACRGLTVADLVGAVHMSRSALEKRFIEQVGHTPGKEILRVKQEMAEHLLTATELSVTRIAGIVGFGRSSIFTEFFKKRTGMTPSEYRRQRR